MKLKLIKMKNVFSTNDLALKLIKKKMLKPTLITSIKQSKGRGTMGKKWISLKGNLFFSIYFAVNKTRLNYKQFAILNAYILKKIISEVVNTKIKINIKWPNDLLIGNKKICGILQEVIHFNEQTFLIIGAGINTNFSPFKKNFKSTSIRNTIRKKINNDLVLRKIKKVYEKLVIESKQKTFAELKKKVI